MMMSKWIKFSLIELKYRFSTPDAPERQRIPGERTGVAHELGERGFLKVGLSETVNYH